MKYLLWLTAFVWLPTIYLWARYPEIIKTYWKSIFGCGLGALLVSLPWDHWAIKNGVWFFPEGSLSGHWFLGLPLEEYLFIFFVPVCAATFFILMAKKDARA